MTAKQEATKNKLAFFAGNLFKKFGLPRLILLLTLVAMFVVAWAIGMNTAHFFSSVLWRWGMLGILTLAMVPTIQSGIGPNFGISVGIVGGMLGAVLSIELRYRGILDFIENETWFAIGGALMAIVMGVFVATIMGVLYGMILNRVKGSEMAISTYIGFSVVNLFNILWMTIPVTAGIMILPGIGSGLRMVINLDDDFRHAFDSIWRFEVGGVTVRTGLLLVFFLVCFFMYLFTRSRIGMMLSAAGANPEYARASGISVDKMRILGTTISTALGGFGIVVYMQSFGFLQMYTAPLMMGFVTTAGVLIGGATVRRARVFDALFGALIFNGILAIALPLITEILPDAAGVPEMVRMIFTNGIILFALTRAKGGR